MTENKIYFQWQNPFLRSKIYPSRNVEMMEFLVTYKEADLVQESKTKPSNLVQNWVRQELKHLNKISNRWWITMTTPGSYEK